MVETIGVFFVLLITTILLFAITHECENTNKYHGLTLSKIKKMKHTYTVLWGK